MSEVSNSIVRICSEDVQSNGYVQIPPGYSSGSCCYVTAYLTQTNYNIISPGDFVYNIGSGNETVTVPAGYYSQAQLVSVLQTMLSAAHTGFTVSVTPYIHLVNIQYTSPFSILGSLSNQRIMDSLGFSQSVTYSGFSSYDGQTVGTGGYKGPVQIMRVTNMNRNGNGDYSTRNTGAVTLPIPYVDYGSTNIYDPSVPVYFKLQRDQFMTNVKIEFLDDYGTAIDFNGGIWNVVFNFLGPTEGHA